MAACSALADLGVLQRHPAETDHQIGMLVDGGPACAGVQISPETAEDMRNHRLGRGKTVGVFGSRVAAYAVQEAMQLALGVVETSGAGPAVRAAEDCLVSEFAAHPIQFIGDKCIGAIPTDGDKRIDSPSSGQRARAVLQPAFANHGRFHPRRTVLDVENSRADGRGIVIMLERQQILHPAVADTGPVRAPMRARQRQ